MGLAPIVLFVYNRPVHTEQTLRALALNALAKESILYIYSDGPKEGAGVEALAKIEKTRAVIKAAQWCGEVHIIESEKNQGLANSVIAGVTAIVNKYGKAIVLEDDLITANSFLAYMNRALELYEYEEKVMQVSGHQFDLNIEKKNSSFFLPLTTTWGWATWKRAWNILDIYASGYEKLKSDSSLSSVFDLGDAYPFSAMLIDQMEIKRVNSWGIVWYWTVFLNKGIVLFPDVSLIYNNGYGEDATHTKSNKFETKFALANDYYIRSFPEKPELDKERFASVKKYLKAQLGNKSSITLKRLVKYIKGKIIKASN